MRGGRRSRGSNSHNHNHHHHHRNSDSSSSNNNNNGNHHHHNHHSNGNGNGNGHNFSNGSKNSSNGPSSSSFSSSSVPSSSSYNEAKASLDFNKVLQEVEGGFQVTWKEILLVVMGVGMLAVLSIFVGIAAGMTISIHYYENQSPTMRRLDHHLTASLYYTGTSSANQRVTTLDPLIASYNVLKRDRTGLDLGKVVTATASGQLSILMVVEETPPLHTEATADTADGEHHLFAANINASSIDSGPDSHSHSGTGTPSPSVPSSFSSSSPTSSAPSAAAAAAAAARSGGSNVGGGGGDAHLLTYEQANLLVPNYHKWKTSQPAVELTQSKVLPTLCNDGVTVGFDNWHRLRDAVQEANSISAERFMKWSAYFASFIGTSMPFTAFDDDVLYYEEDVVFTICPSVTLRARRGPIFINAENVIIECDDCTIDVGGTHLAFGPHAKNVLVRGLTFKGAHTSSLTFFHDGAEASFEDCNWIGNSGMNGQYGAVADVNSTSTVNFYRCEIGQGPRGFAGASPGSISSLSIRS